MPTWLRKQIRKAFVNKDKHQIHLLNECWYYYKRLKKQP
ncbi:MAG: cortex morphogenetic protein CmpA [Bacillus sp. (in: firmicutes)]